MKTVQLYSLTAFAAWFLVLAAPAQNTSYATAMRKTVAMLDSAKTASAFSKAATAFEKVGQEHKAEWLPVYYTALCNVLVAFEKKGAEIDTWCDKAEKQIARADSLSKNNAEICVLRALVASARIQVNKTTRGQKYGGQAYKWAEEAIKLDAANPRAYLQKATAIYYTPATVGGGSKKAKPVFEQALEKYNAYKSPSAIHPHWGKDRVQYFIKQISKN